VLHVATHHRQPRVAAQAVEPVIATPIQSVDLQCVDRRLDCRMGATQAHKFRIGLSGSFSLCPSPLLGEDDGLNDLTQFTLVPRTMETFVHADSTQFGVTLPRVTNHGDRNGIVRAPLHHLVVQDEAMFITHHANTDTEFDGHPCLTLAHPLGVWLEDRKHLLVMGNQLPKQQSPVDLIDLPHCVAGNAGNVIDQSLVSGNGGIHRCASGLGALDMLNGSVQVGSTSLGDSIVPGGLTQGILRGGMAQPAELSVQALELALMITMLPPGLLLVDLCQSGAERNQLSNGIQQQIQVRWIMDVCFNNERVAAADKRFVGFFFTSR